MDESGDQNEGATDEQHPGPALGMPHEAQERQQHEERNRAELQSPQRPEAMVENPG